MITAEEFLEKRGCSGWNTDDDSRMFDYVSKGDLIEFAKLHVKEALEQANENAKNSKCRPDYCESDVLSAYDLDNIK